MAIKIRDYSFQKADRYNYTISKLVINQKEGSENYGKQQEKVLGYYGKPEQALRYMLELLALDNVKTSEVTEIQNVLKSIEEAKECITKLVDGIKGEMANGKN